MRMRMHHAVLWPPLLASTLLLLACPASTVRTVGAAVELDLGALETRHATVTFPAALLDRTDMLQLVVREPRLQDPVSVMLIWDAPELDSGFRRSDGLAIVGLDRLLAGCPETGDCHLGVSIEHLATEAVHYTFDAGLVGYYDASEPNRVTIELD